MVGSFIAGLSFEDLQRLRAVIKAVHFRHYPTELCTDAEADKQIEALGPVTRERIIQAAVDRGVFS